jgi:hypothetical protein
VLQFVEVQLEQAEPDLESLLPPPPIPKEDRRFLTWLLEQTGQITLAILENEMMISKPLSQA